MIKRLLISLVISLFIYLLFDYIKYRRHVSYLNKINGYILSSAAMYYNQIEVSEEDTSSFMSFILMRLREYKLERYINNLNVFLLDKNRLKISYDFMQGEDIFQSISFEISKQEN